MSKATPSADPRSAADQTLYRLVAHADPSTIAEVIALMQSIDGLLPADDGLKWFNRLYLMVTMGVGGNPLGGQWLDPAWLTRLDVVFAGLYFKALAGYVAGEAIPSAWKALFEVRFQPGIDRIQFALAGMKAHINRDLASALLITNQDLNVVPAPDSPAHQDYEAVNQLLATVMPSALQMLATDELGDLAEDTGKIGRVLAFWDISRARDLAWDFAEHLHGLDEFSRQAALCFQDSLTGALGRTILTAV